MKWLRGKYADPNDTNSEFQEMVINQKNVVLNSTKWTDFFQPGLMKALGIGLALMFFQQFTGINAVIFYTKFIFKTAGSTIDSNWSTIIVGLVNIGATFIANALIDKLGRRMLLFISNTLVLVTLLIIATFFYLKKEYGDEYVLTFGWVPLVGFMVYVVGFSIGFGPIPWLMMGEIYPSKIRSAAASITTAFNWFSSFIVAKTFQDLIDAAGPHGTFYIYACIMVISFVFIFFFVPETKGKSLEEIEEYFSSKPKTAASSPLEEPLNV